MMASSGWIRGLCQLQFQALSGAGQAHPRTGGNTDGMEGCGGGHPLRYAGTHPARSTDHKPRRKGPSGNLNLTSTEFGVCPAACWEPSNHGRSPVHRQLCPSNRICWSLDCSKGGYTVGFPGLGEAATTSGKAPEWPGPQPNAPELVCSGRANPSPLLSPVALVSPQVPTYTKSRTELFG